MMKICLLKWVYWMILGSCLQRGGMDQFIKMKDNTYRVLALEFLSTLHVKVTSGAQCLEGYILFYLQGRFYKLNLSAFSEIFGFPPGLNVTI